MAYTKTVWQTGDIITAAKLNNAEGGIEGAYPLVIHAHKEAIESPMILDKTYAEIAAAASYDIKYWNGSEVDDGVYSPGMLYAYGTYEEGGETIYYVTIIYADLADSTVTWIVADFQTSSETGVLTKV